MKRIFPVFLVLFLFMCGCNMRQRELELDKKMTEINQREQQLTLREQSLELREQQLMEKEKQFDSTNVSFQTDSLRLLFPQLPGLWSVKMQCTETNCSGSAVGDTKNEQWDFKLQDNGVIVSAISNNELVKVYGGNFNNKILRLASKEDSLRKQSARILVRLQQVQNNEMSGEREVIQPDGCRILYSLQLKKL